MIKVGLMSYQVRNKEIIYCNKYNHFYYVFDFPNMPENQLKNH